MPGIGSIDGLISGLNTTEIVDTIIAAERREANLLEQEQAGKTNIISAYKALQAKFLALNTELSNLTRTSSYETATISVSDDTILTATSAGRVNPGSYNMQVLALARNHQMASQGFSDQSIALMGTGSITLQVGDGSARTIAIDSSNNSLVGIKKAINDARVGVTASIVNDGSPENPYRLVLSADKTGSANRISITSDLVGGANLNYSTASFDAPEKMSMDLQSTAAISLGTTAAYTGTTNKIYTFTVADSGLQTVGTEPITINWSDGTNSGSIVVTQADTEIELVGEGADGLKLTLAAGTLSGGDTFQVGTFAPTLQQASDARVALGSVDGLGSPIVVTSDSNTFEDLIGGLTIKLGGITAPGESVTVNTDLDVDAIKGKIQSFIKRYNEVVDFIDGQNTYNQEEESSGVLFGEPTLWSVRSSLASAIGNTVAGLESQFSQLYSIGIRTQGDGKLAITNSARFEDAFRENLDDVIRLMASTGSSSVPGIEFLSSSADTVAGTAYDIDITRAATKGYYQGTALDNPASNPVEISGSNNTMQLMVDGIKSREILLTNRTYSSGSDLAAEIQTRIDADENIGSRGIVVEWIDDGSGGHLKYTSSSYGSTSTVSTVTSVANAAYSALGMLTGSSVKGDNVAGTINGEEAEGVGQQLKGKDDSETLKGLVLRVTLDAAGVTAGVEGAVTVTKGVASRLSEVVNSLTKSSDGTFDRRIAAYQNQIKNITDRVTQIDELLALRRDALLKQFYDMETALGQMSSISQYLDSQLGALNSNWMLGSGSRSNG